MPDIERLVPTRMTVDASEELQRVSSGQRGITPFDDRVVAFVNDLSRKLRNDPFVRGTPALAALSFWVRSASIQRLKADWERLCQVHSNLIRVPQGVAFHLPPRNVDTLFVYSWLLSALAGNANVIRLSQTALVDSERLIDLIAEAVSTNELLSASTSFVTYGHEEDVTIAFSDADLRIIWGGDETISAIRTLPSAPYCRDIAFPDRYSMAILSAESINSAEESAMNDLAQRFYNDAYWFDQLGCASPRLVLWLGEKDSATSASTRFKNALVGELRRREHESPGTSTVLSKLVHSTDLAASGIVKTIDWKANDATFAEVRDLHESLRESPGGGLFYEATINNLNDLATFITRKDQTVSCFGLTAEEARRLAAISGARGIDRVVSVGDALTFDRFWDGRDLLYEFTRAISITGM